MIRNKRRYLFYGILMVSSTLVLLKLTRLESTNYYKEASETDPLTKTKGAEKVLDSVIQNVKGAPKSQPKVSKADKIGILGETKEGTDPNEIIAQRRDFVRKMMKDAWNNYAKYAWGDNELSPVSENGNGGAFGNAKMGATIVDAIDTLYVMGLEEQYQKARDWIENKFNLHKMKVTLSLFETNIRFVGGLLSIFALTGDPIYKEKAYLLGKALLPAFDTPTGIPIQFVTINRHPILNFLKIKLSSRLSQGYSVLAEIGTLHLEFIYLSEITGDPIFKEKVLQIRKILRQSKKPDGLYYNQVSVKDGSFIENHVSLGAMGDSFYEYLLKSYIQTGDLEARDMYFEAIDALQKNKLIQRSKDGLLYVAEMKEGQLSHRMGHLACFSGGMFAMGAVVDAYSGQLDPNLKFDRGKFHRASKHMKIGEEITNTCHESYVITATHLGPEEFHFQSQSKEISLEPTDKRYILRPEVIESYFILWRLTGNPKYREWGWDAARAIERFCKVGLQGGYSGIRDVDNANGWRDNSQPSFFLAETLKYLYLLFSSKELISLDKWVFNTEAHPFPIKENNLFYQKLKSDARKIRDSLVSLNHPM